MNQFTSIQKQAIYLIVMYMMTIDGYIRNPETEYLRKVGKLLGMSESEELSAAKMDSDTALLTLQTMSAKNKIIAIAIFSQMMLADGQVDEGELRLLYALVATTDTQRAMVQVGGPEKIKDIIAPYKQ